MEFGRPHRRPTSELPKPDTDLEEWSSRIRAMQRQVDADEEAEQKKLEEEIAASRLARQRRSRGLGYGIQADNLDLSKNKGYASLIGKLEEDTSPNDPEPIDRQKHTQETLNTLTGINSSATAASPSPSPRRSSQVVSPPMQTKSPSLPAHKKKTEISLAEFMGGRATGPRLNKHAPQQDAHDPTQFEQRTRISEPHPVFGRGGIAMPGMTAKEKAFTTIPASELSGEVERSNPTSSRTPVVEGDLQPRVSPVIKQSVVTPKEMGTRDRTMSAPVGVSSYKTTAQTRPSEGYRIPENSRQPVSQSSASTTPTKTYNIVSNTPETRSDHRASMPAGRRLPINGPETPTSWSTSAVSSIFMPRQQSRLSTSMSPPSRKSPVVTPSLAHPIRPEPRIPPQAPQIPVSQNPSPAFLRPAAQKDPTPSISRLQGRGFVQNMVKVSSQMETLAAGTGELSPSNEKTRHMGPRKSSVLDRWPAAPSNTHTISPPTSPKNSPSPANRFANVPSPSPVTHIPVSPKISTTADSSKSLKTAWSLPSIAQTEEKSPPANRQPLKRKSIPNIMPPEGTPGLGSSSTLISYVKTTKTGDNPHAIPLPMPSGDIDELGVRKATHDKPAPKPPTVSELPEPSGKPLSHPTKDRARKPRKARDGTQSQVQRTTIPVSEFVADTLADPADSASLLPAVAEKSIILSPSSIDDIPPVESPPTTGLATTPGEPLRRSPQPWSRPGYLPVKIGRVTDRQADQSLVSGKPVLLDEKPLPKGTEFVPPKSVSDGLVGRQALPGLASVGGSSQSTKESEEQMARRLFQAPQGGQEQLKWRSESNGVIDRHIISDVKPGQDHVQLEAEHVFTGPKPQPDSTAHIGPPLVPPKREEDKSPIVPTRHTRIPSSGNRATVMDIALALNNQPTPPSPGWIEHRPDPSSEETPDVDTASPTEVKPAVVNHRNVSSTAAQTKKRMSNYERYSAIIMPPLEEERTPGPTPSGSWLRDTAPPTLQHQDGVYDIDFHGDRDDVPLPTTATKTVDSARDADLVHFYHVDKDIPNVDIDALAKSSRSIYTADDHISTISVEVMVIANGLATALTRDSNVFYDSEVIAIIHRSKSKLIGLVSTTVWGWRGKRSKVGEREERKLQDLAKRYGTALSTVYQYSEPPELVHLLGGQLATRQGTRAYWTPENTTIHLVRKLNGLIYIDEHDFKVGNLCSGFSYCLSILDALYVWYGRGSLTDERLAALEYAQNLGKTGTSITELTEGENDNDEMFWMMLGCDEYAKADYWGWRRFATEVDPRIWKMNADDPGKPVVPVLSISSETALQESTYIIDCVWEFFVLVGERARGKRRDIKLALSVATSLSNYVASSRPYDPTVHVLVLPTQLPLDLRLNFRDLDDGEINANGVPNHMHILSSSEALLHLQKDTWEKHLLKDHTMLPLGLAPSDL